MATFTKRNNTWRAQVRKKGVVKSKSFRTKAEAVAWANRTEMEIDTGSYSEIVDIVGDWVAVCGVDLGITKKQAKLAF